MDLDKMMLVQKFTGDDNKKSSQDAVPKEFQLMDRYWKASNYLAVGQIYLMNKNPMLEQPLEQDDLKKRLLGHFGTTPGQNFIYVHLNRIIKDRNLEMIYVSGPGHGGPAIVAQTYLEGTYSEIYPEVSQDKEGMGKLFKQFSFPGGIPSHVAPDTPGSMHEGGELGYSLSHSFGIVFDKPDLMVACVVGDGEAETGPLATSWHANKYLNPRTDGAVLPILHLNGYKIANPCILARIPEQELLALFQGYGYEPVIVEGSDPAMMHPAFAKALDYCADKIKSIQDQARSTPENELIERPVWPMIILKSPKGWTGPKEVDGEKIEDSYKAHQVPLSDPFSNKDHMKLLEKWLKSYEPEKQFDSEGRLLPELQELAPKGNYRMGANQYTNPRVKPLVVPDFEPYGVKVDSNARGRTKASDTFVTGQFLRDVFKKNKQHKNFRMFSPDETKSNRLHAVFEETTKQWMAEMYSDDDEIVSQQGRVMEILSEHQCEGWLEGYLLAGGHGLLNSYEAFIHIISSMLNQHAKWLEATNDIPWRNKLSSLNILLTSHVWRQDHNGFSKYIHPALESNQQNRTYSISSLAVFFRINITAHQDPGFLQHVSTKKPEVVRIYLPPDANCMLSCMRHCLRSRHYVNVMVGGKHPSPQWLSPEEAHHHCASGIGIWDWASNEDGQEPDIILACAGDIPTQEALAATSIVREKMSSLKIRFVNVVDLMKLHSPHRHPHGLSDLTFNSIFTKNKPVLFNFHAYPQIVQSLIFGRKNQKFTVRGYREEGTITTPFDMCVMNGIDRLSLVQDICDIVCDELTSDCCQVDMRWSAAHVRQEMQQKISKHKSYIKQHGTDMPEIADWEWTKQSSDEKSS